MAGGVLILLIPICLTSTIQGYFYVFTSLIALQVFFELGINQVLIQFIAHEHGALNKIKNKFSSDNQKHLKTIHILEDNIKNWYAIAAPLFGVVVGLFGYFFIEFKGILSEEKWVAPWVLLIVTSTINFYINSYLISYEGRGRIGDVSKLRVKQSIIGNFLMWIIIISGGELWAVSAVGMCSAVFTTCWLIKERQHQKFSPNFQNSMNVEYVDVKNKIMKLQWKIAISWICGYLSFQLFVPIAFSEYGAEEAGKLGLTMSIFGAIQTLGITWISAKSSIMGQNIATKNKIGLEKIFNESIKQSLIFTTLLIIFTLLIFIAMDIFLPYYRNKFEGNYILFFLSIATVSNITIFSIATYLRAFKEEPMFSLSIATAILISLGLYFGVKLGVNVMIAIYCLVTLFISLPWAYIIWKNYRNRVWI